MVTFDIQASEIRGVVKSFERWEQRRRNDLAALIRDTAESIAQDARMMAPKRTRNLEKSIRANLGQVATQMQATVSAGNSKAFYARMVEFGTKKMAAKPYLIPAYEAHIHTFIAKAVRILRRP